MIASGKIQYDKNELAFLSQAGRANTIYTVLLVVPLFECNKKGIRH